MVKGAPGINAGARIGLFMSPLPCRMPCFSEREREVGLAWLAPRSFRHASILIRTGS